MFCFPSIEADCIEGGGKALFDRYAALIDEFPFGDPLRTALETSIMGGMVQLGFDTAGRITLPETPLRDVRPDRLGGAWSAWATASRSGRATPSRRAPRRQRRSAREGLLARAEQRARSRRAARQ